MVRANATTELSWSLPHSTFLYIRIKGKGHLHYRGGGRGHSGRLRKAKRDYLVRNLRSTSSSDNESLGKSVITEMSVGHSSWLVIVVKRC